MLASGSHNAVSTSSNVSLPATLPSVFDSTADSASVSSDHAVTLNTATSVVAGAAEGSKIITVLLSTRTNLAE